MNPNLHLPLPGAYFFITAVWRLLLQRHIYRNKVIETQTVFPLPGIGRQQIVEIKGRYLGKRYKNPST